MIVYGDPHYEESLSALEAGLAARLASLSADCSLDSLRALLIQSGQLEQALEDTGPGLQPMEGAQRALSLSQEMTDHAAAAFFDLWRASQGEIADPTIAGHLAAMARALQCPPDLSDPDLSVKLPEGFAFYALYPEQYCAAARRWLADHAEDKPRRAVVVGIRSIGTTLSALVAAALKSVGWQTHRLTVRPTGHPLSREAEICSEALDGAEWALIVDEGPGLSGSSLASVANALERAGMERTRISILPDHDGPPGAQASDAVHGWWAATPRYVVPTGDMRWHGRTLPECLAALTPALCGEDDSATLDSLTIDDFGGGLWRNFVYADPSEWPAVCIPFERPKYRITTPGDHAVLWHFAGLPVGRGGRTRAETAFARLQATAESGWTPAPLGMAYGFVATAWIFGVPLTRADGASAPLMAHVGRYIADASGPLLPAVEQESALERLRDMAYWNTQEDLGEAAAQRVQRWGEIAARRQQGRVCPAYSDGRLAPSKWLQTSSGQIFKADSTGHDADHTIIGRQSLVWDVAGALVEWGLEDDSARPLLAAVGEDVCRDAATLTFYRMAYAAFRLGQCTLCAEMSPYDPDEQERLGRAAARYRAELSRLLETPLP